MSQDTATLFDPEDEANIQRLADYMETLRKISGVEPGAHRRMDALDAEWRYPGHSFNPWCCLTVPSDPPIKWVEIEFSSEVSVGLATVNQVEWALDFFDKANGDLHRMFRDWREIQRLNRRAVYTDKMRQDWRAANETQERIDKFGAYHYNDVNFFIFADITNKKVERNTEINWAGHDYPHWDNDQMVGHTLTKDERKQPIIFTTRRGLEIEPNEEERLRKEIDKLYTQQAAMIRRFINQVDQKMRGDKINDTRR